MLLFFSCSATDKVKEAETFTTVCEGDTIEMGSGNCGSRQVPVGGFHDRPDPSAFRVVHALHDLVLDVVEDMASALVFFWGQISAPILTRKVFF